MVVHSRAKVLVCVTMSLVLFVALSSEILMADQEVVHLSKYDDEHKKHGEEEDLKQVKLLAHQSKSWQAPHFKLRPPRPPQSPPCSSLSPPLAPPPNKRHN
ncbi:hypothetical protein LINPERPRIM_LOCUS27051 [Linum perenne]